jgi:hypothetical protein
MNRVRASFMGLGLPFALLCSVAGCKTEEPQASGDEVAQAATGDSAASCVEFAGNTHCSLGAASVALSDKGELSVSNMRSVGKDGVSIHLPDVTSFVPTGVFERGSTGSKMLARSINEGVSTSTMTSAIDSRGISLSASFTGNGQASSYSAIFSRDGQEVGRLSNLPNGQMIRVLPCRPWPWCTDRPRPPIFHIRAVAGDGDTDAAGACSWVQRFDPSAPPSVLLANGQTVAVDNIELREEVPAGGSYPYTSFNRIDYTYDGGTLLLTGEEIR